MPSAVEKMKKLPKYDWPVKAVYITPSTHRFLHRKGSTIDNKEVLISEGDRHTVFVRPKFYVDSSETTWASETVELRYFLPDEFEISTGNDINTAKGSVSMGQACAPFHDSVFQFYDMSEMSDVMKATEGIPGNMEHVAYEIQRIDHLCWQLQEAIDEFDISCLVTQEEKDKMKRLNVHLLLDEAKAVSLFS